MKSSTDKQELICDKLIKVPKIIYESSDASSKGSDCHLNQSNFTKIDNTSSSTKNMLRKHSQNIPVSAKKVNKRRMSIPENLQSSHFLDLSPNKPNTDLYPEIKHAHFKISASALNNDSNSDINRSSPSEISEAEHSDGNNLLDSPTLRPRADSMVSQDDEEYDYIDYEKNVDKENQIEGYPSFSDITEASGTRSKKISNVFAPLTSLPRKIKFSTVNKPNIGNKYLEVEKHPEIPSVRLHKLSSTHWPLIENFKSTVKSWLSKNPDQSLSASKHHRMISPVYRGSSSNIYALDIEDGNNTRNKNHNAKLVESPEKNVIEKKDNISHLNKNRRGTGPISLLRSITPHIPTHNDNQAAWLERQHQLLHHKRKKKITPPWYYSHNDLIQFEEAERQREEWQTHRPHSRLYQLSPSHLFKRPEHPWKPSKVISTDLNENQFIKPGNTEINQIPYRGVNKNVYSPSSEIDDNNNDEINGNQPLTHFPFNNIPISLPTTSIPIPTKSQAINSITKITDSSVNVSDWPPSNLEDVTEALKLQHHRLFPLLHNNGNRPRFFSSPANMKDSLKSLDLANGDILHGESQETQNLLSGDTKISDNVTDAALLHRFTNRVRRSTRRHLKKIRKRLVNKSGSCNIIHSHIPKRKQHYLTDIFTTLLDSKWRWAISIFTFGFLLSWTLYAIIWWLICFSHGDFDHLNDPNWKPCVKNVNSFISLFLFSLETQHTIGYGFRYITEECPEAILVLIVQSITGAMIQGFVTGLIFSKLSRPKKRAVTLMFSKNAVICTRDGALCLLIRIGDMRRSHLVDAHTRAYLFKKRVTLEGETLPLNPYNLEIGLDSGLSGGLISTSPLTSNKQSCPCDGHTKNDVENPNASITDKIFLAWPCILVHRMDDPTSPLYQMSADDLKREKYEIVVILEGMIEATGMSMQARTSYLPSEILWGYRFQKLITFIREDGDYMVDYTRFHNTIPVNIPRCSARALQELRDKFREKRRAQMLLQKRISLISTDSRNSNNFNSNTSTMSHGVGQNKKDTLPVDIFNRYQTSTKDCDKISASNYDTNTHNTENNDNIGQDSPNSLTPLISLQSPNIEDASLTNLEKHTSSTSFYSPNISPLQNNVSTPLYSNAKNGLSNNNGLSKSNNKIEAKPTPYNPMNDADLGSEMAKCLGYPGHQLSSNMIHLFNQWADHEEKRFSSDLHHQNNIEMLENIGGMGDLVTSNSNEAASFNPNINSYNNNDLNILLSMQNMQKLMSQMQNTLNQLQRDVSQLNTNTPKEKNWMIHSENNIKES